ncbi:MAG TPA: hypothetical protein VF796_10850 [Humisphaera sp.]
MAAFGVAAALLWVRSYEVPGRLTIDQFGMRSAPTGRYTVIWSGDGQLAVRTDASSRVAADGHVVVRPAARASVVAQFLPAVRSDAPFGELDPAVEPDVLGFYCARQTRIDPRPHPSNPGTLMEAQTVVAVPWSAVTALFGVPPALLLFRRLLGRRGGCRRGAMDRRGLRARDRLRGWAAAATRWASAAAAALSFAVLVATATAWIGSYFAAPYAAFNRDHERDIARNHTASRSAVSHVLWAHRGVIGLESQSDALPPADGWHERWPPTWSAGYWDDWKLAGNVWWADPPRAVVGFALTSQRAVPPRSNAGATESRLFAASAPCWAICILSGVMPVVWVRRVVRRRRSARRQESGLCLECGYDLRASVGQCPECGSPTGRIAASATA